MFMSLIHTAELRGENPFEFLTAFLRNLAPQSAKSHACAHARLPERHCPRRFNHRHPDVIHATDRNYATSRRRKRSAPHSNHQLALANMSPSHP
jgi:hypothetical protein